MVIFVKSISRCKALKALLNENKFPAVDIHRGIEQPERIKRFLVRCVHAFSFVPLVTPSLAVPLTIT